MFSAFFEVAGISIASSNIISELSRHFLVLISNSFHIFLPSNKVVFPLCIASSSISVQIKHIIAGLAGENDASE